MVEREKEIKRKVFPIFKVKKCGKRAGEGRRKIKKKCNAKVPKKKERTREERERERKG